MEYTASLVLIYMRNGGELYFPVKTIDHALRIADAIADSDLLNNSVSYNSFEVCRYSEGTVGDLWESSNGDNFTEYWRSVAALKSNSN